MRLMLLDDVVAQFVRQRGCWAIQFALQGFNSSLDEYLKAAPWLAGISLQMLADGCGLACFDSYEEMRRAYESTVGDDGPTRTNAYNGAARVYARTIHPDGEVYDENT